MPRSLQLSIERALTDLWDEALGDEVAVSRHNPSTDALDAVFIAGSRSKREYAGLGRPSSTPQRETITVEVLVDALREDPVEAEDRREELIDLMVAALLADYTLGLEPQVQSSLLRETATFNSRRTDSMVLASVNAVVEFTCRPKPQS